MNRSSPSSAYRRQRRRSVAEAVEAFGSSREPGAIDGADDDGAAAPQGVSWPPRGGRRVSLPRPHHSADLLKRAVGRFVERNLGGSLAPFLAYLSDSSDVSEAELRELEELVARLNADKRKAR